MRRLVNPVESMDNAILATNNRGEVVGHRTRIGDVLAPKASWRSLEAVRRAVSR